MISHKLHNRFSALEQHVFETSQSLFSTGAAVIVIHNDEIVTERYWGKQSTNLDAREVQEDTQFHVASVRKSYIGYAVAYAVYHGYVESIDDEVTKYFTDLNTELYKDTTVRHLLTHSHGLKEVDGEIIREFAPGTSWAYRQINIKLLTELVKKTTGKSVAKIIREEVFKPLGFTQSGWYTEPNEKLAEVIKEDGESNWFPSTSTEGDQVNMYVSARELALWGYIYLKEGNINGKQLVNKDIIELAKSLQSPSTIDKDLPQHGFLWFVKDLPAKKNEIGSLVPKESFQILGFTGPAVLVIPEENIVAVRMLNSFGSPKNFDFLGSIRSFGDTVMKCLEGKQGN